VILIIQVEKIGRPRRLDIDWKTIDNHIEILTRYGLVEEKMVVGTAKYSIVTEHGRRVLSLLERSTVPN